MSKYDELGVNRQIIDQYFGVWAIETGRFNSMVQKVQGINLHAHIKANQDDYDAFESSERIEASAGDRRNYRVQGETAIVEIRGSIQKFTSSMSDSTSSVGARRAIRQAARDPDVGSIMLVIDSPGGTVAGTMDLAAEVRKAREAKPVHAFIEDLSASAAYWVASQADQVIANNPTALVGSIGTFAVLQDLSGMAEKLGVKVHVVKAGDFKGSGAPGTEVTDEQLAETQRIVNSLNEQFLQGVAEGRKMGIDKVRGLADGRIHPASDALSMGLVDSIKGYQQAISDLSKDETMSKDSTAPAAATLSDLQSSFPNASAEFVLEQLGKNATMTDAHRAYSALLEARIEAQAKAREEADEAHAKELEEAAKPKATAAGTTALGSDDAPDGAFSGGTTDPVADFNNEVSTYMEKNKAERFDAIMAVARIQPDLHQAYLVATNPTSKARRQLSEKYELENQK